MPKIGFLFEKRVFAHSKMAKIARKSRIHEKSTKTGKRFRVYLQFAKKRIDLVEGRGSRLKISRIQMEHEIQKIVRILSVEAASLVECIMSHNIHFAT